MHALQASKGPERGSRTCPRTRVPCGPRSACCMRLPGRGRACRCPCWSPVISSSSTAATQKPRVSCSTNHALHRPSPRPPRQHAQRSNDTRTHRRCLEVLEAHGARQSAALLLIHHRSPRVTQINLIRNQYAGQRPPRTLHHALQPLGRGLERLPVRDVVHHNHQVRVVPLHASQTKHVSEMMGATGGTRSRAAALFKTGVQQHTVTAAGAQADHQPHAVPHQARQQYVRISCRSRAG